MSAISPMTFGVGDIHGCLDKLERLVARCEAHAGNRPTRFVFVGDYIDRGPNSRGVIEFLMGMQRARPGMVVCLRGNHEQLAINAHDSPAAMPAWLHNSAAATMRNYPENDGVIIAPHLAWLRALPFCLDDGLRFFVHAGVDLAVPLNEQDDEIMLWMREPFLTQSDEVDCGRFIVHGHTPQTNGTPDLRKHRVNLDTAAVMGGPLTAAAFDDTRPEPLGFLTDQGKE
ncbi:MAG TPA: metallophosphoesterase family protein [Xanthobacteraceae bacterium]|nr:metallophosphoesterase family protein [Xanthobacteraceae bacterium]